MNFKLNTEARKVVELLEKSRALRHLAWGLLIAICLAPVAWRLPEIIAAFK